MNNATDSGDATVAQFQPPAAVTATAPAQVHLLRVLAASEQAFVRLGVTESGCNGYMYDLSFASEKAADDLDFELAPGLAVVVSQAHLPLVAGTEIDYVTEGLNSAIRFANPNAEGHCGCGESFNLNDTQTD
ncbi:MAG: iron-sulfur cluster assembly accessory protein [Pseudomonadota bacterium]